MAMELSQAGGAIAGRKGVNLHHLAHLYIAVEGLPVDLHGAFAARTVKPVTGLPVSGSASVSNGLDAILSRVQIPQGVPVGVTGAVDTGEGAGLLATEILGISNPDLWRKLLDMRMEELPDRV